MKISSNYIIYSWSLLSREVPLAFSLVQFLAHTMFISVLEVRMNCRRKLYFIHHISKCKGAQL